MDSKEYGELRDRLVSNELTREDCRVLDEIVGNYQELKAENERLREALGAVRSRIHDIVNAHLLGDYKFNATEVEQSLRTYLRELEQALKPKEDEDE
jgi:predicted nuclease with TOPRIM domain